MLLLSTQSRGSDQNHGRQEGPGDFRCQPGKLQPIHRRHHHVTEDHIIMGAPKLPQSLLPTIHHITLHAPGEKSLLEEPLIDLVIINYKRLSAMELTLVFNYCECTRLPGLQRNRESELGSLTKPGTCRDLTSHSFHEALADCQPQSRASEFSRGRDILLLEGLKKTFYFGWFKPHSCVSYRKLKEWAGNHSAMNCHHPPSCKFQGIRHQVQENLLHPSYIPGHYRRDLVVQIIGQLHPFFRSFCGMKTKNLLHTITELEINLLKLEAPAFDPGKIEKVIDDIQE